MSISGPSLANEVISEYFGFKSKKNDIAYFIYTLDNSRANSIIIAKKSTDGDYENFLKELKEDEALNAVIRVNYKDNAGEQSRICFIHWAPRSVPLKQRLLAVQVYQVLSNQLDGIEVTISTVEFDDISYQNVLKKIKGT